MEFIKIFILPIILIILKQLFGYFFKDISLPPEGNKRFMIPAYHIIQSIIFDKITSDNYSKMKKKILHIYTFSTIKNTKYHLPETLLFSLDDLVYLLKAETTDFNKINKAYQKFCNQYHFYFNRYKGALFFYSYHITNKHYWRKVKLQLIRLLHLFIISILFLILIYLTGYLVTSIVRTMIPLYNLE
ncbi:hypothetical protein [Enterococcus cecorum]|uniref:hypothetical protein n=1 Tax=Enterococcus cecorum TaxID=44008 RepID=UPI003F287F5B